MKGGREEAKEGDDEAADDDGEAGDAMKMVTVMRLVCGGRRSGSRVCVDGCVGRKPVGV